MLIGTLLLTGVWGAGGSLQGWIAGCASIRLASSTHRRRCRRAVCLRSGAPSRSQCRVLTCPGRRRRVCVLNLRQTDGLIEQTPSPRQLRWRPLRALAPTQSTDCTAGGASPGMSDTRATCLTGSAFLMQGWGQVANLSASFRVSARAHLHSRPHARSPGLLAPHSCH